MSAEHPPVVLRSCLAEARTLGVPFDRAWQTAIERAIACVSGGDQAREVMQWRRAFEATRGSWRRAFNDESVERHDGITALGDIPDGYGQLQRPGAVIA